MSHKVVRVIDLVPGSSHALATVDASTLTEERFWHDYVCRHVPVLIRGGAAGWPACAKWQQPGYLERLCGDEMVRLSRTFNPVPSDTYYENATSVRRLLDCIEEMRKAPDDATYAIPAAAIPAEWHADLGNYGFLGPKFEQSPRGYPGKRLFLFKNASTDWHYHHTDETITTQLVGAKRIALFRLTVHNWRRLAKPMKANFHHMDGGSRFFPQDSELIKFEGVLEAGDSIYIPPFWWHGIDPVDASVGVTLAHCFRTPLRRLADWHEPITRELIDEFRPNKLAWLRVMAMVGASTLSRKIASEAWWPIADGPAKP